MNALLRRGIDRALAPSPAPVAPPPLRRYQSVWRYIAAVLVGALSLAQEWGLQFPRSMLLLFIDPIVGLIVLVLMHYRRRWPLAIALIAAGATLVSATAVGPMNVSAVSLSTRRRWREIVPMALAAGVLTGVLSQLVDQGPGDFSRVELVFCLVWIGALIVTGLYIGARRELIVTLQERAERAESEQVYRVAQARLAERARIAREMHDVLAHRISRVSMHAGALAYRTDLSPEETQRTAEVIQTNAHEALIELRGVLGLLRAEDSESGAPEPPQPTLCDIDELLSDARASGMQITTTSELDLSTPPPDVVGRNAYRVIQEALTNAAKHAPNTAVQVALRRTSEDELAVEVRNRRPIGRALAPPGAGLGLVGLSERTALAGGRLEHETTDNGDFVLRAWLPWNPA